MQHASTSPFYPLFASLDVGAQMMKGRSGEMLWDDTVRLGIELRKKLRAVRREFENKEKDPARRWFFDPFVARQGRHSRRRAFDSGAHRGRLGERLNRSARAQSRFWELAPGADWHGFENLAPGFAITDPAKLTSADAGLRPQDRAPMRIMACRRRSSRNICAKIASCRRRTISTRCCSC